MANTSQRYIAFIDILGFKDLVLRSSHTEVLHKLETLSNLIESIKDVNKDDIVKTHYEGEELLPYIFSDSIAIFTKGNSLLSLELLLYACQYLFSKSITLQIPIKGALAHGTITLDNEKSIFFGQSIIDAFLLQEDVKYYGLILHHSVENQLAISNEDVFNPENHVIKLKTPTKSGYLLYYNLKYDIESGNPPKPEIEKKLLESLYNTVSGPPRIYVDNTISMYSQIKRTKVSS